MAKQLHHPCGGKKLDGQLKPHMGDAWVTNYIQQCSTNTEFKLLLGQQPIFSGTIWLLGIKVKIQYELRPILIKKI